MEGWTNLAVVANAYIDLVRGEQLVFSLQDEVHCELCFYQCKFLVVGLLQIALDFWPVSSVHNSDPVVLMQLSPRIFELQHIVCREQFVGRWYRSDWDETSFVGEAMSKQHFELWHVWHINIEEDMLDISDLIDQHPDVQRNVVWVSRVQCNTGAPVSSFNETTKPSSCSGCPPSEFLAVDSLPGIGPVAWLSLAYTPGLYMFPVIQCFIVRDEYVDVRLRLHLT